MSLTVLVLFMFSASCITFISNKMIAESIYNRSICSSGKKSPYGITREKSSCGDWGYCITKSGEIIFSDSNEAKLYLTISEAITEMNMFESIEGYKLTNIHKKI